MARIKRGTIPKVVLGVIGTAGIVSMAAVAPNAIQALDKLFGKGRGSQRRQQVETTLSRLKQKGLIEFQTKNGKKSVRLTKRGQLEYEKMRVLKGGSTKKRWDGKWRIVMFDVEERFRKTRDTVRMELQEYGFKKLQDSVWVYPHDCADFVALLKADVRVGKNVLYITATQIEGGAKLKQRFGIK